MPVTNSISEGHIRMKFTDFESRHIQRKYLVIIQVMSTAIKLPSYLLTGTRSTVLKLKISISVLEYKGKKYQVENT